MSPDLYAAGILAPSDEHVAAACACRRNIMLEEEKRAVEGHPVLLSLVNAAPHYHLGLELHPEDPSNPFRFAINRTVRVYGICDQSTGWSGMV